MNNLIERYFRILKLKKFMGLYVLGFTIVALASIFIIINSIFERSFDTVLIIVGGNIIAYLCLRLFQEYWISKGAADDYLYFFKGNKRNRKNDNK